MRTTAYILGALATALTGGFAGAAEPGVPAPQPAAASLEDTLLTMSSGLHPEALHAALASWDALRARGETRNGVLTVVDYGLPSTQKRLWVFDLAESRVLFHEMVAHGRNSGDDLAVAFSNDDGSFMSSLGAFLTADAYDGRHGYSLRLKGTEPRVNDNAEARAIVLHGASYVDEKVARKLGRLGRSLGCLAVRPAIAHALIDRIKDGSVLYSWHPSLAAVTAEPQAAVVRVAALPAASTAAEDVP